MKRTKPDLFLNLFGRHRLNRIFLICCFLTTGFSVFSQKKNTDTFNIYKASFVLPQPLPGGHYSSSISVLYVVTPKDWTLDNITAPMFSYQAKYTLPKGFNLQAGLSSLIISNRIYLGPYWNYKINDNFIGLGWNVAWNYGRLNQFGFATTLTGWEQQPSIAFGHAFARTAVTFRADLYWTNVLYLTEGKNTLTVSNPFINGYSFYAAFDQKLYKNRALTLALKMDYVQYHIIAWPAFPVNGKRYWMPEFQVGLNL
jgi:hypothetical protein